MEFTKTRDRENGSRMGELLEEYDFDRPQRGRIVQGEIVLIEEKVAYVDIGASMDAVVPSKDLSRLDDDFLENITVGDEVPVYVTETPAVDGSLEVSIDKGLEEEDWEKAGAMLESKDIQTFDVSGYNKGGLLIRFGRLEGFIPNSLVPSVRRQSGHGQRMETKRDLVGTQLPAKVIEVNQPERRLVLDASAARSAHKKQRIAELQIGEVIEGRVTNIVPYGAFIDLGGVDGLLHISNISWSRVAHPSKVLEEGEQVEVLVEDIDVERERISLNRKALLPSPFEDFDKAHLPGEWIEGTVTEVKDFGAFVRVSEEIVGLVHVTEMPLQDASGSPSELMQPGDEIHVEILEVDVERERVRLSTRRTMSP
jgi:small subunit ribosomal protein S1